jgi:hypothetical protein
VESRKRVRATFLKENRGHSTPLGWEDIDILMHILNDSPFSPGVVRTRRHGRRVVQAGLPLPATGFYVPVSPSR